MVVRKITVLVLVRRGSLNVGILLQTHSRVVVREHVFVAIEHLELLERAYKKVGRVVLVRAYFLNDAELHCLLAVVTRGPSEELVARNFSFKLPQLLAIVNEEVTQVLREFWTTNHNWVFCKLLVNRFHNCGCSVLVSCVFGIRCHLAGTRVNIQVVRVVGNA